MNVFFENNRLQLIPEDNLEERFVRRLIRLVDAVSNDLIAWHGDIESKQYRGMGYVITTRVNEAVEISNNT